MSKEHQVVCEQEKCDVCGMVYGPFVNGKHVSLEVCIRMMMNRIRLLEDTVDRLQGIKK